MTRQSNSWWLHKTIQTIAIMALLLWVAMPAHAQTTPNPELEAARQLGFSLAKDYIGDFNSNAKVLDRYINPLQGESQMITQNGQSFDASIQCATSNPLVSIFTAPSGTGDLSTLILQADMNLDGTMDINLNTTIPVSGICSNGLISCDVGTWNNCKAYRWNATPTALSLDPSSITQLSGCYCINNSCGSSLSLTNIGIINRDLGAGAVRAIQAQHADYVVSGVKQDSSFTQFYGATGSGCRTGTTGQNTLVDNPAGALTAVNNEVTNQGNDPKSIYSIVTGSAAADNSMVSNNSCTITRIVQVTADTCLLQPDSISNSCVTMETNPKCRLKSETVDGVQTFENYMPTNLTPIPSTRNIGSPSGYITRTVLTTEVLDYNRTNRKLFYSGTLNEHPSYRVTTRRVKIYIDGFRNFTWYDLTTLTINISDFDNINSITTNMGACADITIVNTALGAPWEVRITQAPEPIGILGYCPWTLNTVTIQGNKTSTIPCNHTVTKNWWQKNRIYTCENPTVAFNFDDAKKRADTATNSADFNTGFTNTYRDQNGNWVEETVGMGNEPVLPDPPPCEQVCKVYEEVVDDRVTPNTTTASVKTVPTRKVYRYPVCTNNTCPTKPGETIEKGCQCLNDFAEAATIMQTIRFAGQDIICNP